MCAGTRSGGLLTSKKNLARDPDFYRKIGKVGGRNGTGHQFAHGKVDPSISGKKGGTISRRHKAVKLEDQK